MTDHCKLNKHQHIVSLEESAVCDKCGEPETADHFIVECPASKLTS